ncbi:MAG: ABC transporter substrate-binding protein [Oscillospiraceae bacterium]|jgi:peptide/nickel transport system substrate-binding protein|nr:ABC transporter substrate-binding protein [Oscillospiraceae bacterium]
MKRIMIRGVAVLLLFTLIFLAAGCNKNGSESKNGTNAGAPSKREVLRLPIALEDSVNPYLAKSTINHSLTGLLFDSLYYVNGNYSTKPQIAGSETIEGLKITVTLDSNKKFSKGSYITAQDVEYSFSLAKQSEYYAPLVSNIKSAKASGSKIITFTLGDNDAYALASLSFPIISSGTDIKNKSYIPLSSGRYEIKDENGIKYLKPNAHCKDFSSKSKKIELVNITDSESIISSLVIGNIDSMFNDLSAGHYERINAGTKDVVMNNFIYLGINRYKGSLSDKELRKAISTIINREKIVNEGFKGYAKETFTPFNPDWYAVAAIKQPGKDANIADAVKYIKDNKPKAILRLVVNADNEFKKDAAEIIAKALRDNGIDVNVEALAFKGYDSAVKAGRYDLFVGEMKLTDNMNIYPLLNNRDETYASFQQLHDKTKNLQEFIDDFYNELPFIPLCYRKGITAFSRDIAVEVESLQNDIYKNIGQWYLK